MRNALKIAVYEGKDGFRWHAKRGGRIVAESGEAYVKKGSATKAANHLVEAIQAGSVEFEEAPAKACC